MNRNQIIVLLLSGVILGSIAVKDLLLGGMKVSPLIILAIVAIHAAGFYLLRDKKYSH
jgi:hypothetical protein